MTHYQKHCPGCYVDKAGAAVCPYCGYDESAPRSRLFLPHGIVIGGQYRVGKVLGRPGGFGITYLGWDVNLQQRVAIKEFLPRDICARSMDSLDVTVHTDHDRTGFDFGKEQFLREARIVAKFDHPNVVRVRSFFNANGTAYLVMDYYEGMSLGDYLTNMRRTIEPEVAVPLIIPILEGLEYVHERNVMHRDVKPANIYLAAIGKPILLDFGAARQAAAGDLARSISVVLTEGYAPLEQYQRRTPQGPWTDVYGLAATLLRMVTGQIPAAALDRLGNDPLAQSNFAGLPDALKPALKRAMAVKPGDRYQTATEFRLALQEFRRITEEGAAEVSSPEAPQAVIAPEQRVQAGAEPPTGLPVKSSPAAQPVAPVVPAQAMSEPISLTRRLDVPPQPAPLPERRAAPRSPGAPVRAEPRTVAGARQAARPVGRRKADEWRPLASIVMALLIAVLIAVGSITWLTSQDAPASPALAPATPLAAEPSKAASTQKPSPYLPKPLAARTPLPEMVQIPSGDFEMGDARSRNNEKPVHPVRVAAFKLGLHEVTVAQFRAFVQQAQYSNPRWTNYPCESAGGRMPSWDAPGYVQGDNHPVVCVSWEDAVAYTQWLSRETGQVFRLPTEAEWEFTARAGTRTQMWWGDQFQEGYANCSGCPPARNAPQAVRSHPKNPLGLFDMNGNVREWTCSMYAPYGIGAESQCGTPAAESLASVRGGSWQETQEALRSAYRLGFEPYRRNVWTGFRVAQELRADE